MVYNNWCKLWCLSLRNVKCQFVVAITKDYTLLNYILFPIVLVHKADGRKYKSG